MQLEVVGDLVVLEVLWVLQLEVLEGFLSQQEALEGRKGRLGVLEYLEVLGRSEARLADLVDLQA